MAPDTLTPLLIDVCMDVDRLEAVREDPDAALAAAGVPTHLAELVGRRRGSAISAAVALSQPLPSAEDIEAFARERCAEDPAFAEAIRREPRPILQRALQVRFPRAATIDVIDVDGLPEVRIHGLAVDSPRSDGVDLDLDLAVDTDTDTDTDVDVDADVEVETDVDTDTDIDVTLEVPVVSPFSRRDPAWQSYWDRRRSAWHAADDRTERTDHGA